MSREEQRSLNQVKVEPAVEVAQRENTKGLSQNLVEETICDAFSTGYCTHSEYLKYSFFLVGENVITETIRYEILGETIKQSFNRWSQWDTFMKILVEMIVSDPGFTTPGAAFVRQSTINAVEEELKREPQITRNTSALLNCSSSASARATPEEKSNARRSDFKRCKCRDRKYQDNL